MRVKFKYAIVQIALWGLFSLAPGLPAWAVTFGETGTGTTGYTNLDGRHRGTQFVCGATGSVNRIFFYCSAVGSGDNGRAAIYDSAGVNTPGNLLAESGSQALVLGWNEFVISSVSVTNGTTYWLSMMTDDSNNSLDYQAYDGDPNNFKTIAHDQVWGAFSDPFGTI